jgi:heme/copper-type cytochrome/quinol oxidase subunit 2
MKKRVDDEDIKLLKFNYENLHQSIWENHKTSWTVTSIFLTVVFALQGFVVKDYFSNALKDPKVADPIQVVLAACIIESLAITWWLIMECLDLIIRSELID